MQQIRDEFYAIHDCFLTAKSIVNLFIQNNKKNERISIIKNENPKIYARENHLILQKQECKIVMKMCNLNFLPN